MGVHGSPVASPGFVVGVHWSLVGVHRFPIGLPWVSR